MTWIESKRKWTRYGGATVCRISNERTLHLSTVSLDAPMSSDRIEDNMQSQIADMGEGSRSESVDRTEVSLDDPDVTMVESPIEEGHVGRDAESHGMHKDPEAMTLESAMEEEHVIETNTEALSSATMDVPVANDTQTSSDGTSESSNVKESGGEVVKSKEWVLMAAALMKQALEGSVWWEIIDMWVELQ